MAEDKRIYYSMGEVAEMFDVNPSLIRFWEQKFDILRPHKNKKGNRLFTPADIRNIKLIYHLVKDNGMTLAGAQKRLKDNKAGVERDIEIADRLYSIRSLLLEVSQELKLGSVVDDFIAEINHPEQVMDLSHSDSEVVVDEPHILTETFISSDILADDMLPAESGLGQVAAGLEEIVPAEKEQHDENTVNYRPNEDLNRDFPRPGEQVEEGVFTEGEGENKDDLTPEEYEEIVAAPNISEQAFPFSQTDLFGDSGHEERTVPSRDGGDDSPRIIEQSLF